jgi:hypothetical protein
MMKPTRCNFHSICLESRASKCFEHYFLIIRRHCTNGTWYIVCVECQLAVPRLQFHYNPGQLTYARNKPSAVCVAPPEDEQVMLETFRGPWFSANWMKCASRWFCHTDCQSTLRLDVFMLSAGIKKKYTGMFLCYLLELKRNIHVCFYVICWN